MTEKTPATNANSFVELVFKLSLNPSAKTIATSSNDFNPKSPCPSSFIASDCSLSAVLMGSRQRSQTTQRFLGTYHNRGTQPSHLTVPYQRNLTVAGCGTVPQPKEAFEIAGLALTSARMTCCERPNWSISSVYPLSFLRVFHWSGGSAISEHFRCTVQPNMSNLLRLYLYTN
jgi:hypothetical protein